MSTVENELKLLLEHDSYNKFLSFVDNSSYSINQVNYYFDTPDFSLNNLGVTLRIRQENNDQWLLCLKIKNDSKSKFTSSEEFEQPITRNDFYSAHNNPQIVVDLISEKLPTNLASMVRSLKICLLGSITNERLKLRFPDEYTCELDRTIYPGNIEYYEMEFEGIQNDNESYYIMKKLQDLDLKFEVNKKSKYKRFVECVYNIK